MQLCVREKILLALAAGFVLLVPATGHAINIPAQNEEERPKASDALQRAVDASDFLTDDRPYGHVMPGKRVVAQTAVDKIHSATQEPWVGSAEHVVDVLGGKAKANLSHVAQSDRNPIEVNPISRHSQSVAISSSSKSDLRNNTPANQPQILAVHAAIINDASTQKANLSDTTARLEQRPLEPKANAKAGKEAQVVSPSVPRPARFMAAKEVQVPVVLSHTTLEHTPTKMASREALEDVAADSMSDVSHKKESLEDEVSDLFKMSSMREAMGKDAFDATPMGGSIRKIQDLLGEEMLPKVEKAHKSNQRQLNVLAHALRQCGKTKSLLVGKANGAKSSYLRLSPLHQTCRAGEAGSRAEKINCYEAFSDKTKIKDLKCAEFAMVKKHLTNQQSNKQIVKKSGGESDASYVARLTRTFCGSKGEGECSGFKCKFDKAKTECQKAQEDHSLHLRQCKVLERQYVLKKKQCDGFQDQMDTAACKRAIDMKDACESYAECYTAKRQGYETALRSVKGEETDRKAEWRGLKRMDCLVSAFRDGQVSASEVDICKAKAYDTAHLEIKYPRLPRLGVCSVPKRYPTTATYKRIEFSPLPALAKGKQSANECTGVSEANTRPRQGSPKSCKCKRVTMNGPYSAGPLVSCTNCLDVRRSKDKNSCPDGSKLFSPRSKTDWMSILASARPLRAPNWIVDITRPRNGCAGCDPKSGKDVFGKSWRTKDGSPWWLKNSDYIDTKQGDYHANCYLDLTLSKSNTGNAVSWNDGKFTDGQCSYHSKSYYCQPKRLSLKPKTGSPGGCLCEKVQLTGSYSAGALVKCTNCLDVYRSSQKNSCPLGTKLFAPSSRKDWKTFLDSAKALRAPNWIIDITRPQDGCGGCTRGKMNSGSAAQSSWKTADRSPWWLRSTVYEQPTGDYKANCYMDLVKPSPMSAEAIIFSSRGCSYHSRSYYCQPAGH